MIYFSVQSLSGSQIAIREEINSSSSVEDIVSGHPMYMNIAVHYVRPKQVTYVRDAFQTIIREVIDSDDLDLEADPSVVSGFVLIS